VLLADALHALAEPLQQYHANKILLATGVEVLADTDAIG
jgi:hypothetical protein